MSGEEARRGCARPRWAPPTARSPCEALLPGRRGQELGWVWGRAREAEAGQSAGLGARGRAWHQLEAILRVARAGAARVSPSVRKQTMSCFMSVEIQVGADLSRLGVGRVPYRNFHNFGVWRGTLGS